MNLQIETLKSYIVKARAAGLYDHRIKSNLKNNGWTEDLIDTALAACKGGELIESSKPVRTLRKIAKLLVIIFVVIPAILIGGAFLFCMGVFALVSF